MALFGSTIVSLYRNYWVKSLQNWRKYAQGLGERAYNNFDTIWPIGYKLTIDNNNSQENDHSRFNTQNLFSEYSFTIGGLLLVLLN